MLVVCEKVTTTRRKKNERRSITPQPNQNTLEVSEKTQTKDDFMEENNAREIKLTYVKTAKNHILFTYGIMETT